jgi:hypothetical protein
LIKAPSSEFPEKLAEPVSDFAAVSRVMNRSGLIDAHTQGDLTEPVTMTGDSGRWFKSGIRIFLCAGIIAGCSFIGGTPPALAQANFSEDFDSLNATEAGALGPPELLDRGWLFRNQSSPPGDAGYFAGPCFVCGEPHAGSHSLDADFSSTSGSEGTVSNWALLPAIAGQIAGDTFVVHARAVMSFNVPPQLQVRYSPGGETGTGSSASDVGDFTQLLLEVNPVPSTGWTRYSVTVPGSGRLALRFFAPDTASTVTDGNTWLEIDTLSVGPPPVPPCDLPPVPQAGQTIAWTADSSPYRVCQSISIPAGGTVEVEAGVQIHFESGAQLFVAGTLEINGTASAPVVVTGPDSGASPLLVTGGTLGARFTEFRHPIQVGDAATLLLSDCVFASGGALGSDDIPTPHPFVKLERSNFTGSRMVLSGCLAILR